jgi:SAM-dependent methyltransferase
VLDDELDAAALEAIADWDELAPDYRAFAARLGAARFAPIDRPLLARAHGDVLEVGCGDGRLLDQIDCTRVRSLVGVDLSPVMTAEAARRGHHVVTAAAERLPLPDESVDVVLSGFYSLRYADLDASFAEVARVLRPGGQFGLTLQGRRAVDLASRAAGLAMLSTGDVRRALRLLAGRESAVLSADVCSADSLHGRLAAHGLVLERLVGVPYLPGLTHLLLRVTGGRLPYVHGTLATLVARDLVLLGHRSSRVPSPPGRGLG